MTQLLLKALQCLSINLRIYFIVLGILVRAWLWKYIYILPEFFANRKLKCLLIAKGMCDIGTIKSGNVAHQNKDRERWTCLL